jgi:toxin-antitoxin system PIN domain toxin
LIIPDINLLLYAYDSDSRFHAQSAAWWQRCLSGTDPVGLPAVVVFGFIRVGTHPRVFQRPMSAAEAVGHVRSWLAQPVVQVVEPGTDHVEKAMKLIEGIGTAGSLLTDAHIAAIALEYGAVLHTADSDFQRFPRLRWLNPLTGLASGRPRRRL